jgi:hypothetical protein
LQQGLALATGKIARLTVALELRHGAAHGPPTPDPSRIIIAATAHVVPAIPLKPTARIVAMDPAFLAQSDNGWLASTPTKLSALAPSNRELCGDEPALRELADAIVQIRAAEVAKTQHFLGRQVGLKLGAKLRPIGATHR